MFPNSQPNALLQKGLAVIAVALLSAATVPPAAAADVKSVNIDLAASVSPGPLTHVADGFLHGLSGSKPSDDIVDQVGVRSLRAAPIYLDGDTVVYSRNNNNAFFSDGTWDRVAAREPVLVGNLAYNPRNVPGKTSYWPGDGGDWETWRSIVRRLVTESQSRGFNGAYSIWNEPNAEFTDHGGYTRYLEAYRVAYEEIRSASPSSEIVGPETDRGTLAVLTPFLDFAKQNGVLPDILAWHELGGVSQDVITRVSGVKDYMTQNGITVPKIYITEYGGCANFTSPSDTGSFIASLEAAGVDAAMRANWSAACGSQPVVSGNLPGAVTTDGLSLTGVGQVYKAYNQMSGARARVTSSYTSVAALASVDTSRKTAWALVSRPGDPSSALTTSVTVTGVPSGWVVGGKVHVRVEGISRAGTQGMGASTPVVAEQDVTATGASISFSVDIPAYGVASIVITPPSASTASSLTYTQIDDASSRMTYSSGWTRVRDAAAYNATKHTTGTAGATAEFTFTGSALRLYTRKDVSNGKYEVFIDDMTVPVATIDAFASSPQNQILTYENVSLSNAQHVVRLRATGQKNSAAIGTFIGFDKAEVAG